MATVSMPSSVTIQKKKIIWFWQLNSNSCDPKQLEKWKCYSDFENAFIENAFRKKEKEVQLNDYVINFDLKMQCNKEDINRQIPVKREEVDLSSVVRAERFSYPESAVMKSFETEWILDIGMEWQETNKHIETEFEVIAEIAAQGILEEGKLLNQEFDAQCIAHQLRTHGSDMLQLVLYIVRLHSAESFLYKLVNSTLTNNDRSKLDTLGPYCHLLNSNLLLGLLKPVQDSIVYRGTTLTDAMVEEYKQAVGKKINWRSFISTTKDRKIAEEFGNTLFIIRVGTGAHQFASDISRLSYYPNEQEVLFTAGHGFDVVKVDFDTESQKYIIHMNSSCEIVE
ncbi:unnamed protein product [Adineta steineri]|uniref:WWE domain-containing protein n=1 Tax=Adineta steineri TaxID=433720 RepID=A0A815AAI9_9BILA|nr:unnamed protein product [Adineta steineri]CAF1293658.1 unnamed protein product [Adineta steineri]CAF3909152.1 unnamed protein product [Adineta steineri]CAF4026937.1 unnamed protein product [Adineta steineri]